VILSLSLSLHGASAFSFDRMHQNRRKVAAFSGFPAACPLLRGFRSRCGLQASRISPCSSPPSNSEFFSELFTQRVLKSEPGFGTARDETRT
jgi:hypothetical protein